MTKRKVPEFDCYKCDHRFQGQASFQGEYSLYQGNVKKIQLCRRCCRETDRLWLNETKIIERQIKKKIEYYTRQHGIDKYADAKRTAYEELLHLLTNETIIFDGSNSRSGYQGDLSKLELMARKIVHEDFMINCEEQVQITLQGERFVVDGLITLKGKEVVLEYDSDYYHTTEQQKERDRYRDYMLTEYGGYTVVRVSEDMIKYEKPKFRSLILDAMYGIKQRKYKESIQVPSNEISNV
jgi:very-short-patch-repair endonuclease